MPCLKQTLVNPLNLKFKTTSELNHLKSDSNMKMELLGIKPQPKPKPNDTPDLTIILDLILTPTPPLDPTVMKNPSPQIHSPSLNPGLHLGHPQTPSQDHVQPKFKLRPQLLPETNPQDQHQHSFYSRPSLEPNPNPIYHHPNPGSSNPLPQIYPIASPAQPLTSHPKPNPTSVLNP